MKENVSVLADSGQIILAEDVEKILCMVNDVFINEHRSKENRFSDKDVCENFDISMSELARIKYTQSYAFNFEQANKEWCGKCASMQEDVEQRFSYGVYAGKMCTECAMGYRDHCGIDQPQGSPAELEAMGEVYYSEEERY